jgi:RNA polymerase sigma factor (sigma-70 family)
MRTGASESDIEDLFRGRFRSLVNSLTVITHDRQAAEDAAQEAFVIALRNRTRFRADGSLAAWVWRIGIRAAIAQRQTDTIEFQEIKEAFVDARAPDAMRDADLASALAHLAPRRRAVIFLRYFADLSYAEIAELCRISVGTVAATLSQAHLELAQSLTPEGARHD